MADKTVYVHPVGDDTGDHYHTLATAIAGELVDNADLVTMEGVLNIIIDGNWSGGADTAYVKIDGFTTSATCYVNIYTTGAARHAGVWNTSAYILSRANGVTLDIRDDYVRIDGLQISTSSVNAANQHVVYLVGAFTASTNEIWISNCIVVGSSSASYTQMGINASVTNLVVRIWNTIVYGISNFDSNARCIQLGGSGPAIYSSTTVGGYYGIVRSSGTLTAKNCYAGGSSNGDYSGVGSGFVMTNCASEDATAEDTAPHTGIVDDTDTFVNVSAGTEDFHLAADGLSPLQGHGVDTTGDAAPLNFTTDIDGQTRDATWDIGADAWYALADCNVNVSDSTITTTTTPTIQQLCGNEIGVFIDEDTLRMKDKVG